MAVSRNPSGHLDAVHRLGGSHHGDTGRAVDITDHMPAPLPDPLAPIPVTIVHPVPTVPERLQRLRVLTVAVQQGAPVMLAGEDRQRTRLWIQVPGTANSAVLIGAAPGALSLGLGWFLDIGQSQEFPTGGAIYGAAYIGASTVTVMIIDRED